MRWFVLMVGLAAVGCGTQTPLPPPAPEAAPMALADSPWTWMYVFDGRDAAAVTAKLAGRPHTTWEYRVDRVAAVRGEPGVKVEPGAALARVEVNAVWPAGPPRLPVGPPRGEPMNVLVTAGNTQAPLDRVRCVTNIFSGRTGGRIAAAAADRGHAVTLLTSHPEAVTPPASGWQVRAYRTFDELAGLMAAEVCSGRYDTLIHSAAVSDYLVAGVYSGGPGGLTDAAAGKVRSTHPELWVRMTPAPKLVDRVRTDWRFRGVLVKFKLEVGPIEAELLDVAERSRAHSGADLMCANTLDGMHDWAVLGAGPGGYERVRRADLADRLLYAVERLHGGRA